ncbi:MAG: 5'-nucleotidase C-terminal domain-containing protein [Elainellaceae cyanobacterium]
METLELRLPSPREAVGPYLRVISVNDIYDLKNYPRLQTVIQRLKATSENAVVKTALSGDFLSPCLITSLDGGKAMMDVLGVVDIDYLCFGNHEFDLDLDTLRDRFKTYSGKCLNSNILNLSITDASGQPLPKYDVIEVGSRQVVLAGFCTDDTDLIKPDADLNIQPVFDALKEVWSKSGGSAALLIPLTHQSIDADRKLAAQITQDDQLQNKVPVILGGHEHEVYVEDTDQCSIVKSGSDAISAVVVDIWWDSSEKPHSAVHLLPTDYFDADPEVQSFVKETEQLLGSLLEVEIFEVKEKMSSQKPRFQPEKVAAILCSHIKNGLKNVDLVMLQGGSIRGEKVYEKGSSFTYGDLLEEIPFDTEIATIQIPGHVLQTAISETRGTPNQEVSGFLHADLDVEIEPYPSLKVTRINHEPFDPQKQYRLGIYQFLLTGLDEIEPLVNYASASINVPPLEQCLPAKNLIMESCMKAAWRRVVDFKAEGVNISGNTSRKELEHAMRKAFMALDKNQDGYAYPADVRAAVEAQSGHSRKDLVKLMLETVDVNEDGKVSMDELASLVM